MITINKFQCEICQTIYDTGVEATNCENSHIVIPQDVTLEGMFYKDFHKWPTGFRLKDKNSGETQDYIRRK